MAQWFADPGSSPRAGRFMVAVPFALIVAIVVVDVSSPAYVHLGPLLVAAPAVTALFAGPWLTGTVAGLAVAAQAVIAVLRDPAELISTNHQAQIIALVLVGACLVLYCVRRERRTRELRQVRYVSETAQRIIMRPLPERIGTLRVASLYLASEAEAQVGGDLYAAARTCAGTRLIIGDVRGKGMPPVGDAALLLGAFRAAAHRHVPLADLVRYLDGSVSWNLGTSDETGGPAESFITAAVLDIPDGSSTVSMIDCGHPPPIVVRDGRVTTIDAYRPAPPLGLGELASRDHEAGEFRFEVGDLLLLYTDGIIEARDAAGTFYPLAQRVAGWTGCRPGAFVQRLERDLLEHVGGHLEDDAAVIVMERLPEPA